MTSYFHDNLVEEFDPDEWRTAPSKPNPSPLHDLKVQLISLNGDPASLALNITWSINIDSEYYDFWCFKKKMVSVLQTFKIDPCT